MKKKIIFGSIAVCFIILFALSLFFVRKLYIKRENLLMAYEQQIIPGIVCYGDSLTFGYRDSGDSYPSVLQERLHSNRMYIPVVNMGIGGENTVTIAGRAGAIPFCVDSFVIPEEVVPVEITFVEEKGMEIRPFVQGYATGMNPCTIAGVEGTLTANKLENDEMQYFFTRSEAGTETYVSQGAEIKTQASALYNDYIFVVFIGQNRGWNDDIDVLIRQQKCFLEMQEKHKGKYIIIGLSTGSKAEREELEKALQDTYGEKFFNIREYMSTEALHDLGVKPTEEDLNRMSEGRVPNYLLDDEVHFTEEGYRLIGEELYRKMDELGYFDELKEAVHTYG